MSLLVRDVMHRGVITCGLDTPLVEVAQRMCDATLTAIVVVDGLGELTGIISRTDLARAYLSDRTGGNAEDIMTADVATIIPDIPVNAAIQIMLDRRIHQLVILHAKPAIGRPVGILSMADVVRLVAECNTP